MPREHPILFSGPMVRALLDGRKTQTRRIVKDAPTGGCPVLAAAGSRSFDWVTPARLFGAGQETPRQLHGTRHCPYGAVGDRLWVREAWASDQPGRVAYRADGECGAWLGDGGGGRVWNRHGGIVSEEFRRPESWRGGSYGLAKYGGRWKPSIHMPRWASRLTLTLTDVRVQRVQEITNVEAQAEGVTHYDCGHPECFDDAGTPGKHFGPRGAFYELWDAINGKGSWDSNPWVWALTFTVAERAGA